MNNPIRGCLLSGVATLCLAACASQAPNAPAGAQAAPGSAKSAGQPAAPAVRKLPPSHFASNVDWYPTKAKQQHDTGRVLLGFTIDSNGKAQSIKVLKAEAPKILRTAAVGFVTDLTFDVSDPAYNAADPAPYAISVRFCIIDCGSLVGYPGYEDARITGSPLTPLDAFK